MVPRCSNRQELRPQPHPAKHLEGRLYWQSQLEDPEPPFETGAPTWLPGAQRRGLSTPQSPEQFPADGHPKPA